MAHLIPPSKIEEPIYVSSYAETYDHDLTEKKKRDKPEDFSYALAEQMAETFAAYILNIISNNQGRIDFKNESFGNSNFQDAKDDEPKNMKRMLMDKLHNAELIEIRK